MATARFFPWLLAGFIAVTLSSCGLSTVDDDDTSTAAAHSRPFDTDTLYSLLVAEVAANRGQLDIALAHYYQQSYKTRDPGVVRRATLLASYLKADQAALDLAQLWADVEPQNPEPLYTAGQLLIDRGKLEQALPFSKRLLALHARPLFLSIAINPAATNEKTHAALAKEYAALLHENPRNIDLLLGSAALLSAQRDFDDSLALIDQARTVDPENLQARLLEVDTLYKSGRPDKAIQRMGEVVNDDPDNDRLRMEYARMLSEQDLQKAREQFDYMAKRNSLEPNLLLARAMVNYRLKDYPLAREFFEQLLFLKHHANTAHFYLGEMAMMRGEDNKALEHYRRVEGGAEFIPATSKAFALMLQQNHRLEGQQWLAELRKQHPERAPALYIVEADTLLRQGDLPRSLAALDEAVRKYPDQVSLRMARSLIYQRTGQLPAAESDLRFVLAKEPDNAEALNALGYLLADSNRQLDEAKNLLTRALTQRPNDPAVLDSMGWLLFRNGEKEEALLRLKQAFALQPDDEIAAHLGEVLWQTDQKTEAQKIWEQGLKLKPDSEVIRSTRQRLQTQ